MLDTEERLDQITHNVLHYLADLYQIISKAQDEANKICEKMLLGKQEVEDLKEMEDKVEDLK